MNLGLALRKQGEHERAKEAFQTAIRIKPNLVTARALLGLDSPDCREVARRRRAP